MLTRRGSNSPETEFISGVIEDVPSDAPEAQKAAAEKTLLRLMMTSALKDTLATLYHLSPAFVQESFPSSREPMLRLAHTAEMYGCESVVKLPIENRLLGKSKPGSGLVF